jgi:hypoxanthine phosphoribosyltransferase
MLVHGIKQLVSNKKKKVSWRVVESNCKSICDQIKGDNIVIDNIIGISRGGLVPASLCAKYLNVRRVYSIGVMSYNDDDDYKDREHNPIIYQCEPMSTHFFKNTLIVDDISDKGNTLNFLKQGMLTSPTFFKEARLFTATLYKKKDTGFHPDYYGSINNDQWLVFPWSVT